MKNGDLLLVYGTLRKGERADLDDNLGARFICHDKLNGLLYNLGSYPGAKGEPGPFDPEKPSITGDVFRLRSDTIVAQLDAYEGYPHLYTRHETETEGGRVVWIYIYNYEVDETDRIVSGDWKNRDARKSSLVTVVKQRG